MTIKRQPTNLDRKAARDAARAHGPAFQLFPAEHAANSLDREHLVRRNQRQVAEAHAKSPPGWAVFLLDSRDSVARSYLRAAGKSSGEVRDHEARLLAQKLIPTWCVRFKIDDAIDLLSHHAPGTSENLEELAERTAATHRPLIAIAAKGTRLMMLPLSPDGSIDWQPTGVIDVSPPVPSPTLPTTTILDGPPGAGKTGRPS